MVKLTTDQQTIVVDAEPEIFRPVPGGWGKHGNTNVRLAKADLDYDAYDPDVVARIIRATGAFNFGAVGDSTGVFQ